MITLTPLAVERLKSIATEDGNPNLRVRIRVVGGGCAGFQYDMYFDEFEPTTLDEVFNQDDVMIVCDPLSFQYLDGLNIDFLVTDFGEGFKFNNPNVDAMCGCGSSFKA